MMTRCSPITVMPKVQKTLIRYWKLRLGLVSAVRFSSVRSNSLQLSTTSSVDVNRPLSVLLDVCTAVLCLAIGLAHDDR